MKNPFRSSAAAAAAAFALAGVPLAHAETFTITQTGFAEGAVVSGYFVGHDDNGDGWLLPYEMSDFSLSFSGNSIVGAFTHSMANRGASGITYQLGTETILKYPYGGFSTVGGLGDNESADTIRYAMWEWQAEFYPGAVTDEHRLVTTYTENLMQISAVPEHGSLTLMAAGLAALGFVARRRGLRPLR